MLNFFNIFFLIFGGKVVLGGREIKLVFLIIFFKGCKLIFVVFIFIKKLFLLSFLLKLI